ncbi:SMI1/KNR4 family protein [Sphingomonas sp. RT2P30]|uniref:SMI1/KNR4 family protein n=1 Tax=Parasphingomonas halimpatiens TaxID=3096162 RepID=UPI002FCBCAE0
MTATIHAILRTYWRDAGDEPARFAQPDIACHEIERCYQVRLPEDFKSYLVLSAPEEDYWDRENVIWWSPASIKNIPNEYQTAVSDSSIAAVAEKCLFFADYMAWCWAWAICCDEGPNHGKVALVGGAPDRWVAESFTEFVNNYVRDPMFIHQ